MLKINHNQWFDLNKLGLFLILVMMFLTAFFNLEILVILVLELLYLFIGIYLYKKIQQYKFLNIILKSDRQWFLEYNNERVSVELKDYWLHTGKIFIWLKGSKKSISFMVSRSIIGAENFSQLRSKML